MISSHQRTDFICMEGGKWADGVNETDIYISHELYNETRRLPQLSKSRR